MFVCLSLQYYPFCNENKTPKSVFNKFGKASYEKLLSTQRKMNKDLRYLLKMNMTTRNARIDRKRQSAKSYGKDDRIYVAIKTTKDKNKSLFKKEIVDRNNTATVLTRSGRKIQKESFV